MRAPRDRPAWTDPMPFPGSQKPPFSVPSGTLIKRLKKPRTSAPVRKTFIQGALPKQKATESRRNPELFFGEMSMKRVRNARRRVLGQGRRALHGPMAERGIQSASKHHQPHCGGQFPGLPPARLPGSARPHRRRRSAPPVSPGGCRSSGEDMPRPSSARQALSGTVGSFLSTVHSLARRLTPAPSRRVPSFSPSSCRPCRRLAPACLSKGSFP